MKIGVIGTGYVGTVTAAVFAAIAGHEVVGIDLDPEKVERLNNCDPIISEARLEGLLKVSVGNKLHFTTDYAELKDCQVVFTCVGTPTGLKGVVDISAVLETAKQFAINNECARALFVIKSTVPPGTAKQVEELIRWHKPDARIVSNPEFLKEGNAVNDFIHGKRIVLGMKYYGDEYTREVLKEVYNNSFHGDVFIMTNESAELSKYACNVFLATKITFANMISQICEHVGADSMDVIDVMKADSRIGCKFLEAGMGFGGSCFPKDSKALYGMTDLEFIDQMLWINYAMHGWALNKMLSLPNYNAKDQKIGLIGVTFKPDTNDCRESPTAHLIDLMNDHETELGNSTFLVYDRNKDILGNFLNECERLLVNTDKCTFTTDIYKLFNECRTIVICVNMSDVIRENIEMFIEFISHGGKVFDGRNALVNTSVADMQGYYRVGKK